MKKKIYNKPLLEISYIDHEISLVMMTGETVPPGPPSAQEASQAGAVQQNNFEENPFGN